MLLHLLHDAFAEVLLLGHLLLELRDPLQILVEGSEFWVHGYEVRFQGSSLRVSGLGRFQVSWCRDLSSGCRLQGGRFRVWGLGFWVLGFKVRVLGFGF